MSYYYRYELLMLSSRGDTCSSQMEEQDEHHKLLVAIVFLSCKATENIRSVRDVFNTVYSVVHEGASVEWLNEVYIARKHGIVVKEHDLLRRLRFDIDIDLPHKYFLNMARYMDLRRPAVQMGWLLLNDAYSSSKVLLTRPEVLAISGLILAVVIVGRIALPLNLKEGDTIDSDLSTVTNRLLTVFDLPLRDVTIAMKWMVQQECLSASIDAVPRPMISSDGSDLSSAITLQRHV